jgi:hypothetical protein
MDDGFVLVRRSGVAIVGREFRQNGTCEHLDECATPVEQQHAVIGAIALVRFPIGVILLMETTVELPKSFAVSSLTFPCAIAEGTSAPMTRFRSDSTSIRSVFVVWLLCDPCSACSFSVV